MNNRRIPDFDSVARAALAASPDLLQQWFPAGRLNGRELAIGDLAGNPGDSCRINVETGKWADFATDHRGGDLVSLYAAMRGLDQGKACHELAGELGLVNGHDPATSNGAAGTKANGSAPKAKPAANGRKKVAWTPIHPVPDTAPRPSHHHFEYGDPSAVWTYTDADGRVVGYICRFEKAKGKEIVPQSWCRGDNGKFEWRWLSFAKPRPIYGLQALAEQPDATVVLVEGEKTADAGARLLPKAVVVTFPGGSKAWRYVDWSPLKGRKVIVVPDADGPGCDAFDGYLDNYGVWKPGIAQELQSIVAGVRVVQPPDGVAPGWDLADALAEGWSSEQTEQFIRRALRHPSKPPADPPPADEGDPVLVNDDRDRGAPDYGEPPSDDSWHGGPCQHAPVPLGYDRGVYYYLAATTHQVTALSASQHNKAGLMSLAGLTRFWERTWFFARNGVSWDTAADSLMRACEVQGVFSQERLRGRGAWIDRDSETREDRVVLHLGNTLLVDGNPSPHSVPGSRYIYETAAPLTRHTDFRQYAPLSSSEAKAFLDVAQDLRWERDFVDAYLYAGFCAIAPICGVLRWRPSIWITSAAGSGKTFALDRIRDVLSDMALNVAAGTTESGIRNTLQQDARPVIFDEFEREDVASKGRAQELLGLVRQSASDSSADIVKGTKEQNAPKRFRIRSCFVFSSINVGLEHYADESRITVLSLQTLPTGKDDPEGAAQAAEQFERLEAKVEETFTDEFCARFVMRSVQLAPVIRDNALMLSKAAANKFGNRRIGDQIGTLIAGAFSLTSSRRISRDEADEIVAKYDFKQATAVNADRDESNLLSYLMQQQTRVSVGNNSSYDRTIGEVIMAVFGNDQNILADQAVQHLRRMGILVTRAGAKKGPVDADGFVVANKHHALSRILHDTPWSTQWWRPLQRLPTARPLTNSIWIGPGTKTRGTWLPLEVISGENQ